MAEACCDSCSHGEPCQGSSDYSAWTDDQLADSVSEIAAAVEVAERLLSAHEANPKYIKALGNEPEEDHEAVLRELRQKLEKLQARRVQLLKILCEREGPNSEPCRLLKEEGKEKLENQLDEAWEAERKIASRIDSHERLQRDTCSACGRRHRGFDCNGQRLARQKSLFGAVQGRELRTSYPYRFDGCKRLARSGVRVPVTNPVTALIRRQP
jgi:hypothetical protein